MRCDLKCKCVCVFVCVYRRSVGLRRSGLKQGGVVAVGRALLESASQDDVSLCVL